MTDLHARLLAAVTARRELAQAATPGPWANRGRTILRPDGDYVVVGVGARKSWPSDEDAEHIAFNDPAQILRDIEAHLKILERHKACAEEHREVGEMHWTAIPYWRHAPEPACHQHASPTKWPCSDWLDVAGIYPEVNEP